MKKDNFDASLTATVASENNESHDRQLKIKQLYFNSYSLMRESAFERFPDLLPWDFDSAMSAVAALLPTYKGPIDAESFERFIKRKAIEEAFRFIVLRLAMGEYRLMLLSAIRKEMWTSAQDRAVEVEDIYSEVLLLLFQKGPKFLRGKKAKLSTRLCGLARRHVFYYFNKKNKTRLAAVERRIERGGEFSVEVLSVEEQASERASLAYANTYESDGAQSLADGYEASGMS